MRCSPRRELGIERNHNRGCSFEIGSPVKARDDDLALFNDMQMRERDNFLLHSTDDFEDTSSKLKYFPDFKLNIPVRGVSSDLLNVESDKNDYDWLLTPPDTPLFPSLDDDKPMPVNLVSRSRPPTQPITISRSSMTEKNHRMSRRSESPRRLSPSPRSGSSTPQLGGRPSYAPHSSPTPVSRPTPSSRRPASPPSKPSTSTPRSSTPTLRRMSTGSSGNTSSSARKGASPAKASRGNSASPKLRGWQSSLPGFSSDAPPNLRTSLSDRTASHSRGLSPAYRNRCDLPLRCGRQSLSPTASRSVSSNSKGSIASCGDDDVDSMQSVNAGTSASVPLRRNRVFANSRNMMSSKKQSRTLSVSSAPKRSFDSIMKQMDEHKSPQNMFRPLLSSVPASTFYVGKANAMQRAIFSRNSSLTTSSNASSDLGASVAFDTEGSEHDQNDIAGEWEKMLDADVQEEVFAFDNMDEIVDTANEVSTRKPQNIHGNFGGSMERTMEPEDVEQLTSGLVDMAVALPTSESSYDAGDHCQRSKVDSIAVIAICSKCDRSFRISESTNGNVDVCQECTEKDEATSYGTYPAAFSETVPHASHNPHLYPGINVVVHESCEKLQFGINVPTVAEEINSQRVVSESRNHADKGCGRLPDICPINTDTSEIERHLPAKELECQPKVFSTSYNRDGPEGAGISVLLLKRSNSGKGPLVRGRSVAAASVFCAEPSYTADNVIALKISVTRDSCSTSSSVDLGSARQLKACQQQLSSSEANPDIGCARNGAGLSCQSAEACLLGDSSNLFEDLTHAKLLYTVDNLNVLKGCDTLENLLASSIDLGTSRQTEAGTQRQSRCSKDDVECVRLDVNSQTQSTQMFLSGVSCNLQEDLSATHVNESEEKVGGSAEVLLHDTHGKSQLVTEEHGLNLGKTESCGAHSSSTRGFLPMGDEIIYSESCGILDSSLLLVSEAQNALQETVSASDTLNNECCASSVYSESHLSQNSSDAQEVMLAKMLDSCPFEEDELTNGSPCRTSTSETLVQSSSCATAILEDGHESVEGPQTESDGSEGMSNIVESPGPHSIFSMLGEDVLNPRLESNSIDRAHGIYGESVITVEGPGGNKSRCLTLEEATDTILFCSSIIHDLAFKAAAIGMEKECSSPEETYRPTAVTLGKCAFDETYQKMTPRRHRTKLPKVRRKMLEMAANTSVAEPENSVEITKFPTLNTEPPDKAGNIKPMKLESKCNCTVM